jgi:hypothetical protein
MSERPEGRESERGPIRIDRHLPNQIAVRQVSIYGESGPLRSSESGKQ